MWNTEFAELAPSEIRFLLYKWSDSVWSPDPAGLLPPHPRAPCSGSADAHIDLDLYVYSASQTEAACRGDGAEELVAVFVSTAAADGGDHDCTS